MFVAINRKELEMSERILVPKGKDNSEPRELLQEYLGVEIPNFDVTRNITINSNGYDFTSVKARDIPGFLQEGFAALGALGSDLVEESEYDLSLCKQASARMCRIALLSADNEVEMWRREVNNPGVRGAFEVITRTPRLLGRVAAVRGLPLIPSKLRVTGSEEGMPEITGIPLVTAQIASGETAIVNQVGEVMNLFDTYACVYERRGSETI